MPRSVFLLLFAFLLSGSASALEIQSRVLATGNSGGLYYEIGTAFQQLVNTNTSEHGVRLFAERSRGSVENVDELLTGRADFAIVQADVLAKQGAQSGLRAVMGLHAELLTIVARQDLKAGDLAALGGRRVNLAAEGSGSAATVDDALRAAGLSRDGFRAVVTEPAAAAAALFCGGKLDALVIMSGHPRREVGRLLERCGAELVTPGAATVNAMVRGGTARSSMSLPAGTYPGQDQPIATVGMRAVLAARSDLPASDVITVLRSVYPHANDLGLIAPALRGLTQADLAVADVPVPLHDGAAQFFAEVGASDSGR